MLNRAGLAIAADSQVGLVQYWEWILVGKSASVFTPDVEVFS